MDLVTQCGNYIRTEIYQSHTFLAKITRVDLTKYFLDESKSFILPHCDCCHRLEKRENNQWKIFCESTLYPPTYIVTYLVKTLLSRFLSKSDMEISEFFRHHLRFYVKKILEDLKVKKVPFLQFYGLRIFDFGKCKNPVSKCVEMTH